MPDLRVTITTIQVHNNGEATGKGELYWNFDVNSQRLVTLDVSNPRKTNDGELISLGNSVVVTIAQNAALSIQGQVSEKDWPSKDEMTSFTREHTNADNFGVGSHDVRLTDRRLDVTVRYSVARA